MDKSLEYIKMCNCPEIQSSWKQKIGDCTDNGIVVLIHSPDKTMQVRLEWNTLKHKNNLVWLPRQDQLQEMIPFDDSKIHTFWHFKEFLKNSYDNRSHQSTWVVWMNMYDKDASMEQLWLAFVMHELHKKVWTGEKWEEK